MGAKETSPAWEKFKTVICTVLSCLMIPIIAMNVIIMVKMYFFKQEVPDIAGFFPVISLTEDSSPYIEEGDLILCKKVNYYGKNPVKAGDMIAHFANGNHTGMYINPVESIDGQTVICRPLNDSQSYELPLDEAIGNIGFTIPILGYIIYFLSTVPGYLLCVVIPAILLIELYLLLRKKSFAMADDEESLLWAELKRQKAERALLVKQAWAKGLRWKRGLAWTELLAYVVLPTAVLRELYVSRCEVETFKAERLRLQKLEKIKAENPPIEQTHSGMWGRIRPQFVLSKLLVRVGVPTARLADRYGPQPQLKLVKRRRNLLTKPGGFRAEQISAAKALKRKEQKKKQKQMQKQAQKQKQMQKQKQKTRPRSVAAPAKTVAHPRTVKGQTTTNLGNNGKQFAVLHRL